MEKIMLEATREGYSTNQVGKTLTAGELIELLQDFDENTPVYFSNDRGYTYGRLTYESIRSEYEDEDDE